MSEPKLKRIANSFVFKYSMLFVCCAFLSFMWQWLNGRTFIWVHDGYDQHYKALLFYGEYLRNALSLLFSGHIADIPSWSYYLGEGGDILGVLNYYVIGDPINLFAVFFNETNTHVLYSILVLARIYLAGLSFSFLCKTLGRDVNSISVVGGAITYSFSMWAIHNAGVQNIFLSPLYILPLLIAGVELVIKGKKAIVFILSVFLAAITNFYFFYDEVLFVCIYVAIRVIVLYKKNFREYLRVVLGLLYRAVIGVLMAAVVLLPSLYAFMGDGRNSIKFAFKLFYPLGFYARILAAIVSPVISSDVFLFYFGFTSVAVVSLVLLATRKGNIELKVLGICAIVFTVFPVFGRIFNGMSYSSGKWTFALSLFVAYVVVVMWEDMLHLFESFGAKNKILLAFAGGLFLLVLVFSDSRIPRAIIGCVMLLLVVLALCFGFKRVPSKYHSSCLIALIVVGIAINAFWIHSIGGDNYGAQDKRGIEILDDNRINEVIAFHEVCGEDDCYFRYSGSDVDKNWGLVTGHSSIAYFWTLSNPNVVDFNMSLAMTEYKINEYTDYDYRTVPLTMSSTLYYVTEEPGDPSPYGYDYVGSYVEGEDEFSVYRNSNFLGASYSLDRFVTESDWDSCSPVERESILMSGLIVEDQYSSYLMENGLFEASNAGTVTKLPCELEYDENAIDVDFENGLIRVKEPRAIITLNFDCPSDVEAFVSLEGLRFEDDSFGFLMIAADDVEPKIQEIHSSDYDYYNGRENYVLNLGYSEEPRSSVKVLFLLEGDYYIRDVGVYTEDVSGISDYVAELNEVSLNNFTMEADYMSGTYSNPTSRLLTVSVPYHEGWSAYIDGEEVPIIRTNIKYMGLLLPAGEHFVEFKYETPFLKLGAIMSVIGFVAFAGVCIMGNKKSSSKS